MPETLHLMVDELHIASLVVHTMPQALDPVGQALVKMDSAAMKFFESRRAEWAADDLFASPGPRQLWGPVAHQQPISVALNSNSDSLAFKIG